MPRRSTQKLRGTPPPVDGLSSRPGTATNWSGPYSSCSIRLRTSHTGPRLRRCSCSARPAGAGSRSRSCSPPRRRRRHETGRSSPSTRWLAARRRSSISVSATCGSARFLTTRSGPTGADPGRRQSSTSSSDAPWSTEALRDPFRPSHGQGSRRPAPAGKRFLRVNRSPGGDGVHLVRIERDQLLERAHLVVGRLVAPDGVLRAVLEREVGRLALEWAVSLLRGAHQAFHLHVGARDVIDDRRHGLRALAFLEGNRSGGVRDYLAAERHADPHPGGLRADAVGRILLESRRGIRAHVSSVFIARRVSRPARAAPPRLARWKRPSRPAPGPGRAYALPRRLVAAPPPRRGPPPHRRRGAAKVVRRSGPSQAGLPFPSPRCPARCRERARRATPVPGGCSRSPRGRARP